MGCARRAQNWNYISSKLWCSHFNTISILKLFFVSCNINFNLKLAPKIFLRAARAKLKLFSIEITMNLFSVTISILPAKIVIFRFAPFYKRPVDKRKLKFHRRRNTYKTFYAMAYALCRQAENSFLCEMLLFPTHFNFNFKLLRAKRAKKIFRNWNCFR